MLDQQRSAKAKQVKGEYTTFNHIHVHVSVLKPLPSHHFLSHCPLYNPISLHSSRAGYCTLEEG